MKGAANDREPAGGVCAGFRGGHRLNPGYPAFKSRLFV
jgi:hypothetical protein